MNKNYLSFDPQFLWLSVCLALFGLLMVESSSIAVADRIYHNSFYFFNKQLIFLILGSFVTFTMLFISSEIWERIGFSLLFFAIELLILVLIFGSTINGSKRWINLILINIQASEIAKLFLLIYLSGYLVRRNEEIKNSLVGFVKPMAILIIFAVLLLLEPDFGATIVIFLTSLSMLFFAGLRLREFFLLLFGVTGSFVLLAISAPYRMQRLFSFMDPWQDQFGRGYQLVQALISYGRGSWFGLGLGNGIQKLHYLPEPHTDFIFTVVAEELGLVGFLFFLALFSVWLWKIFDLSNKFYKRKLFFQSYLSFGLGMYFATQIIINLGVNLGLLPTKGLTLPLISYGGSSLLVNCAAVGILLRLFVEYNRKTTRAKKL